LGGNPYISHSTQLGSSGQFRVKMDGGAAHFHPKLQILPEIGEMTGIPPVISPISGYFPGGEAVTEYRILPPTSNCTKRRMCSFWTAPHCVRGRGHGDEYLSPVDLCSDFLYNTIGGASH
jgi:hypothetical protein